MTHPTDALRLVPVSALEEVRDLLMERIHGNPARSAGHNARLAVEAILAAPASPLPEGGGQCSGITGELEPRLVEWGYTSLDEAITHLGKLLDDQTAFDGLGDLIAELKEARGLLETLDGHLGEDDGLWSDDSTVSGEWIGSDGIRRSLTFGMFRRIRAFLARNGKGDGQ